MWYDAVCSVHRSLVYGAVGSSAVKEVCWFISGVWARLKHSIVLG